MLSRRLQILIDEDRYRRLSAHARQLGVSVAAVIRAAIDTSLPAPNRKRARAAAEILDAPPMDIGDPAELRAELDELRARRR
jgi:hypothetical protein